MTDVAAKEPVAKTRVLRPRDAATLIMVDSAGPIAKVLMGKRRMDLKFHPGKYVFPGGRVDRADRSVATSDDLGASEIDKLMFDMKGTPSAGRARALALAAVRETYEEAGLIIGEPSTGHKLPEDASWRRFFEQGYRPSLGKITFVARAITPPGRPRRFDTRFFCVDASAIAFRGKPPEDELSDLVWMPLIDARELDLPPITRVILEDIGERLKLGPVEQNEAPVPYYYRRHGNFKRELITGR